METDPVESSFQRMDEDQLDVGQTARQSDGQVKDRCWTE